MQKSCTKIGMASDTIDNLAILPARSTDNYQRDIDIFGAQEVVGIQKQEVVFPGFYGSNRKDGLTGGIPEGLQVALNFLPFRNRI